MVRSLLIGLFTLIASPAVALSAVDLITLDSQGNSRDKAGVGPVIFPHEIHKKSHKCAACHPKIFKAELGANNITMKQNMNKMFCGSPGCHNSPKAFPLFHCNKCHAGVKK